MAGLAGVYPSPRASPLAARRRRGRGASCARGGRGADHPVRVQRRRHAPAPGRQPRVGGKRRALFLCWCDVEPEPGRYDFALLDRHYADFLAHGIRPVVDVVGTPTWARAECASRPRPCLYPPNEAELPRWRELFRVLAQRYPGLYGLEVWNEAHLAHFWKPRVDPARYVRLLKAAHAGVRRAHPDLPVVAGALCLCGGGEGGMGDLDFLDRMYRAGARGSFDALSVHNYPTDLPVIANARDKLAGVRRVRERHGDRGTPLWVTEAGISTAAGGTGGHPRLTEALQARALADLAKTFRQARDVDVAIFFRFRDITGGFTTWEDGLGIAERGGWIDQARRSCPGSRHARREPLPAPPSGPCSRVVSPGRGGSARPVSGQGLPRQAVERAPRVPVGRRRRRLLANTGARPRAHGSGGVPVAIAWGCAPGTSWTAARGSRRSS